VGVVALLLALAVGLVIVAGSQRHVPAPFGPAANGSVAYEAGGDIFTADPVTGVAKALVTGQRTCGRSSRTAPTSCSSARPIGTCPVN
jgi:hypothetical protein